MKSGSGSRRAVFLDRDGTLIREREYLSDPDGVELLADVPEAMIRLRGAGFVLVIVTNQSGIARGLYTLEDYRAVAQRVEEVLEEAGAPVDRTYFCPHHPEFSGPCQCRKPETGLYRQAARELGLDLGSSYYVGDRVKDVRPALSLGGTGILVRTGYGSEEEQRLPPGSQVVDTLLGAADWILGDSAG